MVLVRRWYVVLPLLLLTVGGALSTMQRVPSEYQAGGTLLFFNPPTLVDPDTGVGNPFAGFGNLQIPANVISRLVKQDAVREELADNGAGAEYTVELDTMTNAPVVIVTATGERDEVVPTVEAVLAKLQETLDERQRATGAPRNTWLTTEVLTAPDDKFVTELTGSKMRAGAAIMVLGLALTVSAAFLTESILSRRRAKRTRQAQEEADRAIEQTLHARPPAEWDSELSDPDGDAVADSSRLPTTR